MGSGNVSSCNRIVTLKDCNGMQRRCAREGEKVDLPHLHTVDLLAIGHLATAPIMRRVESDWRQIEHNIFLYIRFSSSPGHLQ